MVCTVIFAAILVLTAATSCTNGDHCTDPFSLPSLPYPRDALEPVISAKTIDYHYGKHHAGYVSKLNLLAKTNDQLSTKSLESLLLSEEGKVFNLAAQIWNHNMFWECMKPFDSSTKNGPVEESEIAKALVRDFGSFEQFQAKFAELASNHFGSGWTWLVQNKEGGLSCVDTHDAGNPMTEGLRPLLVLDNWEHSFYLDYQHDKPAYIRAWWNVVNWNYVEDRLRESL